jgi:hypothetical protein
MRSKRAPASPASPLAEISAPDRDLLKDAYKAGLILGWKHDPAHGFRLALGDKRDEYVEHAKLSSYLATLRNTSAR